eukprot:2750192-Pleurochrysis_carterae.AAC.1
MLLSADHPHRAAFMQGRDPVAGEREERARAKGRAAQKTRDGKRPASSEAAQAEEEEEWENFEEWHP